MQSRIYNIKSIFTWNPLKNKLIEIKNSEILLSNGKIIEISNNLEHFSRKARKALWHPFKVWNKQILDFIPLKDFEHILEIIASSNDYSLFKSSAIINVCV